MHSYKNIEYKPSVVRIEGIPIVSNIGLQSIYYERMIETIVEPYLLQFNIIIPGQIIFIILDYIFDLMITVDCRQPYLNFLNNISIIYMGKKFCVINRELVVKSFKQTDLIHFPNNRLISLNLYKSILNRWKKVYDYYIENNSGLIKIHPFGIEFLDSNPSVYFEAIPMKHDCFNIFEDEFNKYLLVHPELLKYSKKKSLEYGLEAKFFIGS